MNLDLKCAETAEQIRQAIVSFGKDKEAETLITKALGVLQEDGNYAFYLYMKAKKETLYNNIEERTVKLLKDVFPSLEDVTSGVDVARTLSSDIDKLFLSKELLERTLVYARYHAKALEKSEKKDSTEKAVDE